MVVSENFTRRNENFICIDENLTRRIENMPVFRSISGGRNQKSTGMHEKRDGKYEFNGSFDEMRKGFYENITRSSAVSSGKYAISHVKNKKTSILSTRINTHSRSKVSTSNTLS